MAARHPRPSGAGSVGHWGVAVRRPAASCSAASPPSPTSFGSQPDLDISSCETKGGDVLFRRDYAVQFRAWIGSRLARRRALNQVKPGAEKVGVWRRSARDRLIAAWGYYDEAAMEGVPVIICQLCDKVLVHGGIDGRHGGDDEAPGVGKMCHGGRVLQRPRYAKFGEWKGTITACDRSDFPAADSSLSEETSTKLRGDGGAARGV